MNRRTEKPTNREIDKVDIMETGCYSYVPTQKKKNA